MAWRTIAFAVLAFVVSSPGIGAAEVVEFRSGLYLEVSSHELTGNFVRLNLAQDSFLIVPVDGLETIERNGVVVYPSIERRSGVERKGPTGSAEALAASAGRRPVLRTSLALAPHRSPTAAR